MEKLQKVIFFILLAVLVFLVVFIVYDFNPRPKTSSSQKTALSIIPTSSSVNISPPFPKITTTVEMINLLKKSNLNIETFPACLKKLLSEKNHENWRAIYNSKEKMYSVINITGDNAFEYMGLFDDKNCQFIQK